MQQHSRSFTAVSKLQNGFDLLFSPSKKKKKGQKPFRHPIQYLIRFPFSMKSFGPTCSRVPIDFWLVLGLVIVELLMKLGRVNSLSFKVQSS